MSNTCELKEIATMHTVSIRRRTPVGGLKEVLGEAYGAAMAYLQRAGEQPSGPPFVIYRNMDMASLDIEAGFPVARELPGDGAVRGSTIPACSAASCLYQGPYNRIESAYEALGGWIRAQGLHPSGESIEFYLNDPEDTPPEALLTEILFPVRT